MLVTVTFKIPKETCQVLAGGVPPSEVFMAKYIHHVVKGHIARDVAEMEQKVLEAQRHARANRTAEGVDGKGN